MAMQNQSAVLSENWLITDENGRGICNFVPQVITRVEMFDCCTYESQHYVTLCLAFANEKYSEKFTVKVVELDTVRWLDKDSRAQMHPASSQAKMKRYLQHYLRAAMESSPIQPAYRIDQLGLHIIGEEPAFCTGGGVIRPSAGSEYRATIHLESMLHNLDFAPEIDEATAVYGIMKLASLSLDSGRIILTYQLAWLMRHAFRKAWKAPSFCVFLYGRSGVMKTSYSALLTLLYDGKDGIPSQPRLNISEAAANEILFAKRECVVVFDDLHPSDGDEIRQQHKDTLLAITRTIADAIEPVRKNGNNVKRRVPECGVLFTGEKLVGTGSNAARLLPVKMIPLDGESLKFFQNQPLIVPTFYHYFISWYVEKYSEIEVIMRDWHDVYSQSLPDVNKHLWEAHYFLTSTFSIFLQYLVEKNFINEQDAQKLHAAFQELLDSLVELQQEQVQLGGLSKESEARNVDYLGIIAKLYKNSFFRLADTAKEFDDLTHDGVIHDNFLCLRGEQLKVSLQQYVVDLDFDNAINSLSQQGALKTVKKGKKMQIYDCGGKRFYAIPLGKLK